eukprot:GHVS01034723.1.p1 GENE.GHVS01034723.1~~GHVS01034723.1.p1  ORF type:complete len:232 (+),score=40.30 GHVS01034723.1:675-1370(+)
MQSQHRAELDTARGEAAHREAASVEATLSAERFINETYGKVQQQLQTRVSELTSIVEERNLQLLQLRKKVESDETVRELRGEKASLEQRCQTAQRNFRLQAKVVQIASVRKLVASTQTHTMKNAQRNRKSRYRRGTSGNISRILTLTRDAEIRQRRSVEGGGDAKWRQTLEKKVQDSNDRIETLITELRFTKKRLHGEETKSRDLSTHAVKLEEAMEHSRLEQAAAIQQVH